MEDTSPMVPPTRVKRDVTIQEINNPPMPNTFDVTVHYPSDGLPEWFAPLQPVLEDQTVDSMEIVIGGGRVRYHITVKTAKEKTGTSEQIAAREWHTRAIVRIVEAAKTATPEGGRRDFYVGEEVEMVQWGREGRPVTRDSWWTSFDIDGAHIIKASKVEVVRVLEEVLPEERLDGFNDLPLDGDDDSGWDTPPPGPILG